MTVDRLQSYLDKLLAADRRFDSQVVAAFKEKAGDGGMPSEEEMKFLAEKVLDRHRERFADEAARRDLDDFLRQRPPSGRRPWKFILDFGRSIPGLAILLVEAFRGQGKQMFKDGRADPATIRRVREFAGPMNVRGAAGLVKVDPRADLLEIEAALQKAVTAIRGFDFLDASPAGRDTNEHTILIKPGVNWGQFGYPTITSWQSVYALTKMCFQEADKRGARVEVIVGDESGIEIILWGGTTMENFETTDILHAAVSAGLERAASLEATDPGKFAGAPDLLNLLKEEARAGRKVTSDPGDANSVNMIEMARRAGVRVVAFDDKDVEHKVVPVPGAKHFRDGAEIPTLVAAEVTDIINLPKPPGRHLIMGNTGLTGALKNHVGLLAGSKRSPGLHGSIRYPALKARQDDPRYAEELQKQEQALLDDKSGKEGFKLARNVLGTWGTFAPDLPFHEKIVELYAAVAAKERFSVTDMRRTVSSLGPDLGNTIDIGAVIAATDPLTLDVLAGALLKRAYEGIGGFFTAAMPGGETLLEYWIGKTWLEQGTPFDLLGHIAANSYGYGPVDWEHIDLKEVESSGFSPEELQAISAYLQSGRS